MSKGKQPRTRVNKVPKLLLSEIKIVFLIFHQEIGLEAAIFLRPRNRALIKLLSVLDNNIWKSIDNLTDLKQYTDTLSTYNLTIFITWER